VSSAREDPLWPRASSWLAALDPTARLAVIGVPLSRTSISPSGAHTTPAAVRAALSRFACYHAGLDVDLPPVQDLGDLDVASYDTEQALTINLSHVQADLVVVLGGDNAVTRPAMRTLMHLPSAGLLTLDAHHDVRGPHAGWTNGTPVRGLLEDGLPGRHVVQIGLGELTNSRGYRTFCQDADLTLISAEESRSDGVQHVVRRELDRLAQTCTDIYVDLDVDVVDRAFVPGCPGARPGGLTPSDLLEAAVEAGRHPSVRAIDIVEVDATADPLGITVDLAAMCLLSVAAGFAARLGAPGTTARPGTSSGSSRARR